MAFVFQKFQEFARNLAKSSVLVRDPRKLQFEADVNRLFLYTSYNRLGENAEEADAEEVIDMASRASLADQQKQVQENVHLQIKSLCKFLDEVLLTNVNNGYPATNCAKDGDIPSRSGLAFAVGKRISSTSPVMLETQSLTRMELSGKLKEYIGFTLDIRPSHIPHTAAGLGLFLCGQANVGDVVAFYPGLIYSPAYYKCIPGYPRIGVNNSYLITRYDGYIINGQPWGLGGDARELWDGFSFICNHDYAQAADKSDCLWKLLSPPEGGHRGSPKELLERRNPLAFAHFANHPAKGATPNVMVCPYDFPLTEEGMRCYIPNIVFGGNEEVGMKRFGNFWFKSWRFGNIVRTIPVLRTLVLVAIRSLCDEEIFLNYRLSSVKRQPAWYTPVDVEEDRRRWG